MSRLNLKFVRSSNFIYNRSRADEFDALFTTVFDCHEQCVYITKSINSF